jgi:hypothetical protein
MVIYRHSLLLASGYTDRQQIKINEKLLVVSF